MKDKEKELIIPAINGVRSLFRAAATSDIKRIVLTSSFGAVLDMTRPLETPHTYTSADWNPITYAEAVDPNATPQDAYRGSKTFAEQEAWRFMEEEKPKFDLVVLCPSMVFGPVAGKLSSIDGLGESDRMLWRVVSGGDLPPARFNFWVDVRDLAECHVRALLTAEAGGKRYLPMPEEKFSYQRASEVISKNFPEKKGVAKGVQVINEVVEVDGKPVIEDLGVEYRRFEDTVVDLMNQIFALDE